MGTIRIIKTPNGEAPTKIRRAWLGVEMPLFDFGDESTIAVHALSQTRKQYPRRNCWMVEQKEALDALAAKNPAAAKWWRDRGFPREGKLFTFGFKEATEIKD